MSPLIRLLTSARSTLSPTLWAGIGANAAYVEASGEPSEAMMIAAVLAYAWVEGKKLEAKRVPAVKAKR